MFVSSKELHRELLKKAQETIGSCTCCTPEVKSGVAVLTDMDLVLKNMGIDINKALNPQKDEDYVKLENRYARLLNAAYTGAIAVDLKALKKLMSAVDPKDPETITEFTARAAEIIQKMPGNAAKEVAPVLSEAIEDMYRLSRRTKINQMVDKSILEAKSDLSAFGTRDKQVVEMMTRNNKVFVNEGVEAMVEGFGDKSKGILEEALEKGWPREVTAQKLQEAAGTTIQNEHYWNIVSSNYTNRSRNWANLEVMREVDFEEYQIMAVGDERTCPICDLMNGKTFSIEKQIGILERSAESDTMGEYTSRMPWLTSRKDESGKIEIGVSRKSGFKAIFSNGEFTGSLSKLQGMGFAMPPFHGLCRCTIIEG